MVWEVLVSKFDRFIIKNALRNINKSRTFLPSPIIDK